MTGLLLFYYPLTSWIKDNTNPLNEKDNFHKFTFNIDKKLIWVINNLRSVE